MRRRYLSFLPLLLLAAPPASAESPRPSIAATLRAGTLGNGVDLSIPFADTVNLRLGYGQFSAERQIALDGINYEGTARLGGRLMLADWYPFGGPFRLSAGVVRNQSRMALAPRGHGPLTLGATDYVRSEVSLSGRISLEKNAPYVGFGFGNPSARARLGYFLEFGAARQRPQLSLSGTCDAEEPGCDTFDDDLGNERAAAQHQLSKHKWFPLLQLGVSWRY